MLETSTGIEEPTVDSKQISPISTEKKHKKNPLVDRALGLTMPTKIPGTQEDRGLVERFERAKLFEAFIEVKKRVEARVAGQNEGQDFKNAGLSKSQKRLMQARIEARKNDPEFKDFREQAAVLEAKLDILNRQFFENQTRVHVDDLELGVHDIPVVTLDLNPPKEGEKDERIHTVIVGTYASNPHQIVAIAEAIALQEGQVVDVLTYPEKYKMSGSSPDWVGRVRRNGTLRPYVKLFEKVANGLGTGDINLVGTSMGAPIVMEMAADPDFAGRINNLTVMDPPLTEKSGKRLVFDFLRDSFNRKLSREQIVKAALSSNRPDLTKTMKGAEGVIAPILGKADAAKIIGDINPKGKFQVWVGSESAVTGKGAREVLTQGEMQRISNHPNYSPMKMFVVEGAHHQTLFSTLGIASHIVQEKDPEVTIIPIQLEDLASNGAESILRDILTTPTQGQAA